MKLTRTSPPRVLLVEDDAISREVLALALQGVPADVHAVASLAAAREALAACVYDAWLVDAHLPDGDGRELLAARPASTIALAHTAATDARVLDGLVEAGFVEVLVKPIAAGDVQAALRRALAVGDTKESNPLVMPAVGKQPVWDDDVALRALAGNASHVRALRGLFVGELETELDALAVARTAGDAATIRGRVHRLRASCGFVGAARVAAHLPGLEAMPLDDAAFDAFADAMRDTKACADPLAAEQADGEAAS